MQTAIGLSTLQLMCLFNTEFNTAARSVGWQCVVCVVWVECVCVCVFDGDFLIF